MFLQDKTMNSITITKPDDFHLHLRDGDAMASVVNHSAKTFARAMIMPNIAPPVTTVNAALEYKQRIMDAVEDKSFSPLMTLYLTENISANEIKRAQELGFAAVKYYPAGATTNSEHGVSAIKNCTANLELLQEIGLPLSIHGEVTDPDVDIFDREKVFIDRELTYLTKNFPELKIVCEHATTKDMVQFVEAASNNIGCTITAHHLFITRNDIFNAGINPHHYCLPIAKTFADRDALIQAATSGNPQFFAGTDSAPHPVENKIKVGASAGIFTAHAAIELYCEAFDKAGALDKLEAFMSFYGADYYDLERNSEKITLSKEPQTITDSYPFGDSSVVPFFAGKEIEWTII